MGSILDGLRIGFIGAGAMAEAMMRGLAGSGCVLAAGDPDPARRSKAETYGAAATADNKALVEGASLVILAVKPQVAQAVLAEVGGLLRPDQTFLSIVAGLRLVSLCAAAPGVKGVIRAMPNAPAGIGAGVTAVSFARRDTRDEELARAVLAPLGAVVPVPETLMDAVTGLSGSGPAYVALFAEALIEAGVKTGLPRPLAHELAVRTLLGSARLLAEGEAPGSLRERVTSPGGTTAYGLYALERGGLRAAVSEAVSAAAERAAQLGELSAGRRDTR